MKKLIVMFLDENCATSAFTEMRKWLGDFICSKFSFDFDFTRTFEEKMKLIREQGYDYVAFVDKEYLKQATVTLKNLKTCEQKVVKDHKIYENLV